MKAGGGGVARKARACAAAVIALLLLDFVWLYLLGVGDRFAAMARRLTGGAKPWPAWRLGVLVASVYALLGLGLCVFALLPALDGSAPRLLAAAKGALLGATIYGVYDLTNLAVFGQGYDPGLAASDVAWGTVAFGAAALAGATLAGGGGAHAPHHRLSRT
jgi:uncharacterized membrane protein